MENRPRRLIRWLWLLLVVAAPVGLLLGYESTGLPPDTLTSDARVEIVLGRETFDFIPRPDDPSRAGLLFFPGGLIEPEAYAPMARALAEQGHYVVIVRLPFRISPTHTYKRLVFDTALQTMASSPRKWAVGGHARGGKIAAEFAAEYSDRIAGLVLVATPHPRRVDLSKLPTCVPVTRIFGSRDPIAPLHRTAGFEHLAPPHTAYVEIDGANHRQFGYYGFQLGDRRATIDRAEQQRRLIEGILLTLRPRGRDGQPVSCG